MIYFHAEYFAPLNKKPLLIGPSSGRGQNGTLTGGYNGFMIIEDGKVTTDEDFLNGNSKGAEIDEGGWLWPKGILKILRGGWRSVISWNKRRAGYVEQEESRCIGQDGSSSVRGQSIVEDSRDQSC
jgi:hypothetical protein